MHHKLNQSEEIQLLIARHVWVLEEAVYDCKLQEANKLTSSPVLVQFKYLTSLGVDRDKLRYYVLHCEGSLEELCYAKKRAEAKQMFSSTNDMYQYLKQYYGSRVVILSCLRNLLSNQKVRRKTKASWSTK